MLRNPERPSRRAVLSTRGLPISGEEVFGVSALNDAGVWAVETPAQQALIAAIETGDDLGSEAQELVLLLTQPGTGVQDSQPSPDRARGVGSTTMDEVVRQHVFIEAWLAGTTTDEAGWQQFADVLDDEFVIVPPTGTAQSKPALLERFHAAHGAAPGARVEIRNAQLVHATADAQVVRYEEWQLHDTRGNQRV